MIKDIPARKKHLLVKKMFKKGYSRTQIAVEVRMSSQWVGAVLRGELPRKRK